MSAISHNSLGVRMTSTIGQLRLVPTPPIPDQAARERFAKRRAAGKIAEALATAVGRSSAESGTARLATLLAADAGALKIAARAASTVELKQTQTPPVVTRSKTGKLLRALT